MKKFIYLISIFGAILLGLAYIADYALSKRLKKSTTRMLVGWNEIYSGNLQHDVLIIGGSRAWVQYSPQIIDSILGVDSYVLAIDGSQIDRQILKYDTYRRMNNKPEMIIHDIGFATIGTSSGYEREQFFPYFFDDTLINAASKFEKFTILEKYIPAYRYIGYSQMIQEGIFLPVPEAIIKKGYYGIDAKWDGSNFKQQIEINYRQDSLALMLFDKHLAKAHSENIRVIFVYAPLYIGVTEKLVNVEGMYQMFDSIARKYNIPILDYNFDPMSYDTANFYNATHLNRKSAELFSVKLAHDIDLLEIIKQVYK